MTTDESKLLEKIEREVSKIGETQAYLRGRLEEIHSRTAEIPSLITGQTIVRKSLVVAWTAIILGMLATAPSVFTSLIALMP